MQVNCFGKLQATWHSLLLILLNIIGLRLRIWLTVNIEIALFANYDKGVKLKETYVP